MKNNTRARLLLLASLLITSCGQGALARTENTLLWAKLGQAPSISEGTGGRTLYVFFDLNCPYCHHLYDDLQPLIGPNSLKVAWIPVGILTLSSYGKAAAVLEAADPALALEQAEHRARRGKDGIRPRRASPRVAAALRGNERLLNQAGGNGVPFLVYKDQRGHVRAVVGDPPRAALVRILAHIKSGH